MSQAHFQQFVAKKKNSVIKEEFKQAKKKAKKERAIAIDKRFEEKRRLKAAAKNAVTDTSTSTKKIAGAASTKTIQHKKEEKITSIENNFEQAVKIAGIKKEYAPPVTKAPVKTIGGKPVAVSNALMPLNKFLAHCGVCSRRDAVTLIKDGKVKVNDTVVIEPAFKVSERDDVKFNGKKLFVSKNLVYILLNKPKDYITTTDDPQGRKTVLQLTKMATTERIYPVGRLDRNTSGVLLLTNDGELTQKLSHPSYNITKVYEARLDKNLTKADFDKILNGVKLEDGEIKADSLAYADAKDKSIIGIEIHSGRNRIVRRIFEHLGYDVKALDRVMYATLTKKNVERGKWRFLSEKEVRLLKYLNASHKKIIPAKPLSNNIADD
jgi:23S rRNA pseudouridine2605 synthase